MASMNTAGAGSARLAYNDVDDAIALLKADHDAVRRLFMEYEKSSSELRKRALVTEICTNLSVHAQIEHEIFYPEVRAALGDSTLVPEASVAHAGVDAIIALLGEVEPAGAACDARVGTLAKLVRKHLEEEECGMFPLAESSWLDMFELGARMAARKHDLLVQAIAIQRGNAPRRAPHHDQCGPQGTQCRVRRDVQSDSADDPVVG